MKKGKNKVVEFLASGYSFIMRGGYCFEELERSQSLASHFKKKKKSSGFPKAWITVGLLLFQVNQLRT